MWCVEIDAFARRADAGERGVDGLLDGHDERHDRAVVRLIGGDVENRDALDGGDRVANGGDDLRAAAFREVRNAFDQTHGGEQEGESGTEEAETAEGGSEQ